MVFYYPCKFTHAHATIHGPMGLAYIASHLRHHLGIEDIKIEVDPYRVLYHKPDIVGVSAYTETYPQALEGAQMFKKELGVPVLLGGPHMNAMPSGLPQNGPFDVAITGEGEHSAVALVDAFLKGQWGPDAFADIPGAVFYDKNDTLVINPKATSTEHLDNLYYPRRELLEAWFPTDQAVGQWRQGLYTSRDCPFRCRFCIHSTIQGMPRYHSVERVITELGHILRYYPDQEYVTIYDDIFVVSKKRLAELVSAIRTEGIQKKLGFVAMVKPSTFNDEVCLLLKEMNVGMVSFGFETGSSDVLKYLKGRGARLSQHQEAVDLCRKHNIRCTGYFIMGSPVETPQDLAKTYWFIQNNKMDLHSVGLFSLTPYPGTKFWYDYIERRGQAPDHEGWEVFDHKYLDWDNDYPFFINEHYSPDFLKNAHRRFRQFRSDLPSDPEQERHDLRVKAYKKALYDYLEAGLENKPVFEVSQLAHSYTEQSRYEDKASALYRLNYPAPQWPESLKGSVVYLNHCLEQMPRPGTFLRELYDRLGDEPVYLSFYNALFLPVILALLKGQTPDIFEPPFLMQQHRFFTLLQMNGLLSECGFQVTDVHRNPQEVQLPQNSDLRLLPELLAQMGQGPMLKETHIYSYLLKLQKV